jgi:serine/threonine protein kinase/formylglycine-generating enzyme required for sulfatase activity
MPQESQRAEAIYREALSRPAQERPSFVAALCAGDTDLRRAVEALLTRGNATELRPSGLAREPEGAAAIGPGVVIGSYRIDGILGRGGMGVVYRATDTRLNRPVAIKFLSKAFLDASAGRRFQREAQLASALNHPHIVTVHDVGEYAGSQYLVTEFVDGGTLEEWRHAEPRTWRQVAELLIGVADALATAHAASMLHRDVKPANVLVSRSGYAKLADFGLAKTVQETPADDASASYTRAGAVIGTPAYMSPEQISGRVLDARSDIFAFGVVLYEMLASRRPFDGATELDLMHAVMHHEPEPLPVEIPEPLRTIVAKAIEKDPAERYQSMRDLVVDLKRVARRTDAGAAPGAAGFATQPPVGSSVAQPPAVSSAAHSTLSTRRARRPAYAIVAALVLAVLAAGSFAWYRSAQARWAHEAAIPEVARLTDRGDYRAAFDLAERAKRFASDDALLRSLTPLFTVTYSVTSTPPDASVFVRSYSDETESWQLVGRTPLTANVARRALRWRVEKPGFEPAELARSSEDDVSGTNAIDVALQRTGTEPGMVFVPGGTIAQSVNGMGIQAADVAPYFIDRYEVTNAEYKEFVVSGAYERASYWEGIAIEKDGGPLAWDDAMRLFVDTTGRPGPATWELGDYPAGQAQYPVTGISWYEASAYARFRGKTLPTVYHWANAALPSGGGLGGLMASVVPASNYASAGPAPVGRYRGLGPYGTYDMHGNVSEWAANFDRSGRVWTLGGNWQDAPYNFSAALARPPLERSPLVGFRLARNASAAAVPDALLAPLDLAVALTGRKPASDDVYAAYAEQFSYQPGALNATEPETLETTDDWIRQRVTVDTGYGERMDIVLFVPRRFQPPYAALVYFPPFDAMTFKASSSTITPGHPVGGPLDFVVKSGRVVVQPIYQGTYERFRAPLPFGNPLELQRRWVDWRWDMGRTLDYLETRADVDAKRIGYVGVSFGATFPLHLPAVERRFRAALFISGGLFYLQLPAPLEPVTYAARITMPVLMINGRFDYLNTPESQARLFDLLGTPAADKRRALVDSGHLMPRAEILRESLGWLDEQFGAVRALPR